MNRTYDWEFPLPRTHTGILQGNGTMGTMIWGEERTLCITIGRADRWDHRGGMPWTEKMSYKNIRRCLKRNDENGLRKLFEMTANAEGEPRRPSVIPIGRLELDLGAGAKLESGTLHLEDGAVAITVRKKKKTHELKLLMDMTNPVFSVSVPRGLGKVTVSRVPAWDYVGKHLASVSFKRPRKFAAASMTGWIQQMPVDPDLCIGYREKNGTLFVTAGRGDTPKYAKALAETRLNDAAAAGSKGMAASAGSWWRKYWRGVPGISIPNERLAFLYWYGMYKFAGSTNPAGVPATLQGPWIEEYQMPPWSNDYHFNINVQMCYQPAYYGNKLEHLRPLFDLIFSWEDTLKHNARVFLGIDDGVMLPHAVDDHCTCMGGFWTGSIDHGCTAWVALMMYRYYRYTMDKEFLKKAYPFMVAAMRVYEEMLEKKGKKLVLPVGVSPEYRGSQMNAWGANASFQLACIHALNEALTASTKTLRKKPRTIWKRIETKLPKACLVGPKGQERIGLWAGTDLDESHRHHSHLSGIAPFDVCTMDDPKWRLIIEHSLAHWIFRGPGMWSGWCVPWASMIHSHVGNAQAAEMYLEIFDEFYTNEGHGTLHDCHMSGFSLMGVGPVGGRLCGKGLSASYGRPEIMQMDGGMGAVAAVQEMLLHTRRGVHQLFAGVPARWNDVSFKHMRTDGAFLVSASRRARTVIEVKVKSLVGGVFRLANPWDDGAIVKRKKSRARKISGRVLQVRVDKGETVTMTGQPRELTRRTRASIMILCWPDSRNSGTRDLPGRRSMRRSR